jgi:hypothetical protein
MEEAVNFVLLSTGGSRGRNVAAAAVALRRVDIKPMTREEADFDVVAAHSALVVEPA